ncbi:hypothetical protein [Streptomyces sannanensis]
MAQPWLVLYVLLMGRTVRDRCAVGWKRESADPLRRPACGADLP